MYYEKRSLSIAKLTTFQNYRINRAKYLKIEKFRHINGIISNSSINSDKGCLNNTVPGSYYRVIDLMIIIINKGGETLCGLEFKVYSMKIWRWGIK